ncbi:NAD(P)/FAD-dependent oxidoreductase [Oricola cellulosilytica]|uniref:FAD-binding oxidoreductase n=1 Tax=Oricola cellulosilytica TaxID=1429082 RepID=A0A4R0PG74_9HYPH|nr:FAD-binding oxidoreductase [Oricola cellulosilytica]TCD15405.1 FAD-binding oxidoreductase [Oricola cellulosilytica]
MSVGGGIFTDDFSPTPYWWVASPPSSVKLETIPGHADAVVVGAGYTGLHAALQIARTGRSVIVFDADAAGAGCSTRNGGQISTSVKPGFSELAKRHGEETASRLLREGRLSLKWIERFIADEGIDCDFRVVGRFHAAHNAARFRALVAMVANQPAGVSVPCHVVSRDDQHSEIGTDVYHGGVVYEDHASLDPGKYHAGLLARVIETGASVAANCAVTDIARTGDGFMVATERGEIRARDVVIATNGYSGPLSPWHQRRVIPIGSYVIATEELPESLIDELIPRNRIVSDTRRVVYYYRASPDRRRILFGGRVSLGETDPVRSAPLLRDAMIRVFPQLTGTRVSHSWMGYVAYTFDALAHTGSQDGLHYAMGYCGSGVGMASYLGMRSGLRVVGDPQGATAFQEPKFETRPLYAGRPWFLAPVVRYYRLLDSLNL